MAFETRSYKKMKKAKSKDPSKCGYPVVAKGETNRDMGEFDWCTSTKAPTKERPMKARQKCYKSRIKMETTARFKICREERGAYSLSVDGQKIYKSLLQA